MVSDGRRKSNHLRLRKEKFELDNKGRGMNALSRESDVLRDQFICSLDLTYKNYLLMAVCMVLKT